MKTEFQILNYIPTTDVTGEEWGLNLSEQLMGLWVRTLEETDLPFVITYRAPNCIFLVSTAALDSFDAILLTMARNAGWRMDTAEIVQARKSMWDLEPGGPEKIRKLGEAYQHNMLLLQGRRKQHLDPGMRADRKATIAELGSLLELLRGELGQHVGSRESLERRLTAVFVKTVEDDPVRWREVHKNLRRWQEFFEQEEGRLCLLAAVQNPARSLKVHPAPLYDTWNSWCRGLDYDYLRESISRMK